MQSTGVLAPSAGRLQVTTVYVGGISFDTDERALQNYFQKFGNVLETKARYTLGDCVDTILLLAEGTCTICHTHWLASAVPTPIPHYSACPY